MEGRILNIVVGWYSGYQEDRYVFPALVWWLVYDMGVETLRGILKFE